MEENVVLTLSDKNQYVIVERIMYENNEYLYLVDINHNENIMFCKLDGAKLKKIQDTELLGRLIIALNKKNN